MQPITPLSETQPVLTKRPVTKLRNKNIPKAFWGRIQVTGYLSIICVCCLASGLIIGLVYRIPSINILLMGIDRAPEGSYAGRSDTIILFSLDPSSRYIGMLSIPRDLWVSIPGYGENRINTAHFYAEAQNPGSGPEALSTVIRNNFSVEVHYFIRIRFDDLVDLIDTLGGVDLDLPYAMGGYSPGRYHIDGEQALEFARDRKGTDDFFRMEQGQLLIKAIFNQILYPPTWSRLQGTIEKLPTIMDTNIPIHLIPVITLSVLLTGPQNIDSQVISRDMVQPEITEGGANVLFPKWDKIRPVILEMFGP